MDLHLSPAENDPPGVHPRQTGSGRACPQPAETEQGRRDAEAHLQQQPGETGEAPGGQAGAAGGRDEPGHQARQGSAADIPLRWVNY